ncbi:hypothetical protein WG66_006516 [Moniliophthora roreri]|uniref:Uncharacterized protein n=1 Tax=Moniliophthora roreri TaxID=221103 RepID=A0A0W0FT40_MONRR|nr:hypothetical protein WG66_006516 [Moniliophthora roreri]
MSSAGASMGTNSPPLEATGSHNPMGATSVDAAAEGKGKTGAVLDNEQRQQYFADSTHTHESKDVNTSAKPRMMGESLQDKFEQGN